MDNYVYTYHQSDGDKETPARWADTPRTKRYGDAKAQKCQPQHREPNGQTNASCEERK